MKLYRGNKKNLILAVLFIIVIGALLSREYKTAGLIVSLIPIGFYIAVNTRRAIAYVIHLKRISSRQKMNALSYIIITYIFIHAIVTSKIYYFMLLIMLSIDFIIEDKRTENK